MAKDPIARPSPGGTGTALPAPGPSISLIGSFRRHYSQIREIAEFFVANGITVPSPSISKIIDPEADYVRFEYDPPAMSDHDIQASTLARLLASDAVYVIALDGYIGLDTSMEIGHLLQAQVPLFFSEPVKNVTMATGLGSVLTPAGLLEKVKHCRSGQECMQKGLTCSKLTDRFRRGVIGQGSQHGLS